MSRTTSLAAAGVAASLLLAPTQAAAEQRTLQITFPGGKTVTLSVEVPDGIPLSAIRIPEIRLPILSIGEAGAPEEPPAATTPEAAGPEAGPEEEASGRDEAAAPAVAGQTSQRATGDRRAAVAPGKPAGAGTTTRRRAAAPPAVLPPVPGDPGYSLALPGPALIGVPDFFIDKFRIPPFLLPIYQAAGVEYGVRWEILAAINEIETDYGRNLAVSSAGAEGWMQFMPATWRAYGLDANGDGRKDPYDPVDAIFSAARYLKASGAAQDIRKALFAYNHAGWYVDSVLLRARLISGTPAALVESLTGLTQGRFPVAAPASYARGRRATNLFARAGAAVVAVQDATVTKVGRSRALGRHVVLRDVYGNTYTYARLGEVARTFVVSARGRTARAPERPAALPTAAADQRIATSPAIPATGSQAAARRSPNSRRAAAPVSAPQATDRPLPGKERLLANGQAPAVTRPAAGGELRRLRVGARVPGGTVLGRLGRTVPGSEPHLHFRIRPAGKGTPHIDPKPILDGWKLLERTAMYRAHGRNALFGPDAERPGVGQILLATKAQLMRRVVANPRIHLYPGGAADVRAGHIDRRVLAVLEFLAASGLEPTVSSLRSNHRVYTAAGRISAHASGNAVDISRINGVPVAGNQGPGSVTDLAVRRLLALQGALKPHQIISLIRVEGADNTLALPDHDDHLHVGFRPDPAAVLEPLQWTRLIDRLAEIHNPKIGGTQ